MIVRVYDERDADALGRLFHETIHAVCRADYAPAELAAWSPASDVGSPRWRERFARTRPWVAVADGEPVGFLELRPDGHIDCCYVHHEWQRRGVGTALIRKGLAAGGRLYAEVSISAVPFFTAHGFASTRQQEVERNGVTLRNFRMERPVASEEESMPDRTGFRRAIEKHDLDALMSVFREDAVLHSPITFQPFEGKAAIRRLLGIILEVFQDFRYTDELDDADGMTKILVFRTKVRQGDELRDAEGIDLIRFDEQGMVRDLTVMVRPRSSLESLLAEVQPRIIAAMQADARG